MSRLYGPPQPRLTTHTLRLGTASGVRIEFNEKPVTQESDSPSVARRVGIAPQGAREVSLCFPVDG